MNWIPLRSQEQLEEIIALSNNQPQVIFKHSTRCNISSVAKNRLERATSSGEAAFYYLDLISYRPLSNFVADRFAVEHESPQILVIKNGKCVYNESHMGIDMEEIKDQIN
ncbi:MAG TPA: bacillithiol system redox-active protein YtxJ [Lacibacter sp.]|nr:bacillithiol system redox-active protein YtxJ [Lacibacter sp.]